MCMTFACGCVTTNTIEQTNQVWRDSTWATEQTTSHLSETHHHHADENTSFDDHVPTQHGQTHQVQKPTEHLKHHYGDKSQVDAMHQQTTVKTSNELKIIGGDARLSTNDPQNTTVQTALRRENDHVSLSNTRNDQLTNTEHENSNATCVIYLECGCPQTHTHA